jgi:hypothetical protein
VTSVKEKHPGISYSVVRTGARSWEWFMHLDAPAVLKIGEGATKRIFASFW